MGQCSSLPKAAYPNQCTGPALTEAQVTRLSELGVPVVFFSNPPSPGYAQARRNALEFDHHMQFPAAVVSPVDNRQVSAAVKFCADNGIAMSVKAGGHGTQCFKGTVVIDLRALNSVTVHNANDPPTVTMGGGCINKEVDAACRPHNLGVTLGNSGTVGSIGAMLGGGVGFLARSQGLTIDGLVSATVCLADGSIVEATSDGEHSELLYCLKGGGGNFGIVLEATVRAGRVGWDPSPSKPGFLFAGARIVRHDNGPYTLCANGMGEVETFKAWRDYALQAPDAVSCDCILPTGGPMVQLYSYKGPYAEAREEAKAWKELGKAAIEDLKPRCYHTTWQGDLEKQLGPNLPMQHTWRIAVLGAMPDEVIKALMHASNAGAPNSLSVIHCERLGGQIDNVDDADGSTAAFAQRGGLFWLSMVGVYGAKGKATPEMKAKVDAWLLELVTAIKPHVVRVEGDKAVGTLGGGGGGAINTFGQQGGAAKARVARLLAAKTKYDPGNVFRFIENGMSNVTNIDPAAGIEDAKNAVSADEVKIAGFDRKVDV